MLDRGRGRIFGINIIDLLVVLIVLFALISYIYQPVDEGSYGGNQMYNAIQDFQRLDSRGFLVEANVTGTFLWDNSPFYEEGLLLPSTGGRLRLKNKKGDIVVIGGERAYVEDVAASLISIKPMDRYLVVFYLDPLSFENYKDLVSHLKSIKNEMRADHFYLDVEIAVDSNMTPSEREIIVNQLNSMYLVRDRYLLRAEPTGFVVNLMKGEVDELESLSIERGWRATTNRMRVYAGYLDKPETAFPSDYRVVSIKDLL